MRAATTNFKDLFYITPPAEGGIILPRPTIPLSDGVGEVVEIGSEVSGFAVGDRVLPIFTQTWLDGAIPADALDHTLGHFIDGVLAEERVFPASGLVAAPAALSDIEASTLPCAGLTAWNALADVRAGQTVLIRGTGAVALFGLQFAVALGARVLITSSEDDRLERCRAMGADLGINYRTTPDWPEAVLDATDGHGADHVLDTVGGESLAQSIAATALGGSLYLVGMMAPGLIDPLPIMMRTIGLRGVRTGSRAMFVTMNAFLERHAIRPVIGSVVPFEQATDAFRQQADGHLFGKIAIAIDPSIQS